MYWVLVLKKITRLEKPLEALNYFNKAFSQCPTKLKILENRENVINEWVPRWHFTMLNDTIRNSSYKLAIETKIREGYNTVLDIGTGTGILSLYSHYAGAKKVFACETNEIMIDIAENVFKDNNVDVTLLPKHSTKLSREDLGNISVDLIVTEIFDCGAFGEDVLSTLIHAKENLLSENGKILPEKIKIFIVGVDRINVAEKEQALESTIENSIYLKNTILTPKIDGPYEPINQIYSQMNLVTDPLLVITVDFNDLESMKKADNGDLDNTIQLVCRDADNLEGFLVYFKLFLDDDNVLQNFDTKNFKKNTINCWDPIVFPLNSPYAISSYQLLNVHVSCKNGILSLTHDYDNNIARNIKIEPEIYSLLTDDEFMHDLEFNVSKIIKKGRKKIELMADFLPFPHIGINFLKENKITTLYCSENIKEFMETVCFWNCIPKSSIKYSNYKLRHIK